MSKMLRALGRDRAGATSIEYGLIAALIAVAIIAALSAVGPSLRTAFLQRGAEMAEPQDVTAG